MRKGIPGVRSRRRPAMVVVAAAVVVALAAGCGSSGGGGTGDTTGTAATAAKDRPAIAVSAATSLKTAFTEYADGFTAADVKLQFAGSDALAAQIEQGVRPDVFAAANTKLPDKLAKAGLVGPPTVFAGNRLVLAVPADDAKVTSLADLSKPGVTIATGAAGVPIGDYTRKVLARLPAAQRAAILANVRSREPDVGGIVGKLSQGAVDAGLVYVTDVTASGGRLKAIELPPSVRPQVAYGVAVVTGSKHAKQAHAFIVGLLTGKGRAALAKAGFEPPPAE